jgi:putative tricarboxylic transport membrane protein
LIANLLLFETAGFVLASTVLFVCAARAFGSRRLARDAVLGLALATVVFVGFTRGLSLALPRGWW